MSHRLGACVVAALCSVAAGCSRRPAPDVNRPLQIDPAPVHVGELSLAPQITVAGDRAIVSWIESEGRSSILKFSERGASAWSEPRTVASGDDWFVNYADVPSVLRLADGTLAAEWLQNTDEEKEAYDIRLAFSKDDGRTWSAPVTPHHDGTRTQHGFASLFQAPGAGLGLVWLDGRALELEAARQNDNMSVRSAVFDAAGRQAGETLVDDRVCDCCPTSIAITSAGPVAAFRDRSAEEVRDIAVSRLIDGKWTPSARVHDDGWQIDACPVNGPALSANGRALAIAWMTAKGDRGHAYAAFSNDAGATFGAPVRLDDEASQGRVGVALLVDGTAVASWIEFAGGRSQLNIRRIDGSGGRGRARTIAGMGAQRAGGYPRLARRGDELLLAWTETRDGGSTVRTAIIR